MNLDLLTDEERIELDKLLGDLVWLPHPDNQPQIDAYFSPAFETLYGGSAGGGKTDLILGLARTQHNRSLLLRREFPDLERSVISRSLEFFGERKYYNASKHVWNIDGRRIEFGHMERIGSPYQPGDEDQYASAPYDFIAFDQLEQFTEYGYIFMFSRARSAHTGQRVRVVATANPVGEGVEWIMRRWAAWLDETHPNPAKSGEIRYYKRLDNGAEIETDVNDPDAISRTFIAAGLSDNPYLGDGYRRVLNLLPEPLRGALLSGNWSAMLTDDAYQVIPRAWVKAAQARWKETDRPNGPPDKIGVDLVRGGDDQMAIAPRYGNWFDRITKHPGHQVKTGQDAVSLFAPLLTDKKTRAYLDVIGIGSSAYDIASEQGLNVAPVNFASASSATDKSGQLHFVNLRAECYWSFREALDPQEGDNIALPPDPELLGDLCAPRWVMQTNGIKIEPKEKIKERIGRSPDSGDAVVMTQRSEPWTSF
jgi:hypothetical protein